MKTKVFFMAIIILFLVNSTLLAQNHGEDDTCEVITAENIPPYSRIGVEIRVYSDQPLAAVTIPLTWNTVSSDITCDSIHWSDWFWDNSSPSTEYSGKAGGLFEDYIDSDLQIVDIEAIWWGTPYLPGDDTTLATIHFTIGKIDLTEPVGGEEWYAGDVRYIRWLASCDWEANDSVVIDSFRLDRVDYPTLPVNFSDIYGETIGKETITPFNDTLFGLEFKGGYLTKAPQNSDSVRIEYSFDAGRTWHPIDSLPTSIQEYTWSPIPNTPSDSCLIRISSKVENPVSVTSGGFFTILGDTTDVREEEREQTFPGGFVLHQNYPNPFNPSTKIGFSLSERAQVQLDIYNVAGKRVKRLLDEKLPPGNWSIVWNGDNDMGFQVASGIYFYRLSTSRYTRTRKMVIIR